MRRFWSISSTKGSAAGCGHPTAAPGRQIVEPKRARKAPKSLVDESGAKQLDRDIRLASLDFTQQSLTFYAERRVERIPSAEAAAEFLARPRPSYLFVPAKVWDEHLAKLAGPHRIAARRYDFYRHDDILVVTNDGVQR